MVKNCVKVNIPTYKNAELGQNVIENCGLIIMALKNYLVLYLYAKILYYAKTKFFPAFDLPIVKQF